MRFILRLEFIVVIIISECYVESAFFIMCATFWTDRCWREDMTTNDNGQFMLMSANGLEVASWCSVLR